MQCRVQLSAEQDIKYIKPQAKELLYDEIVSYMLTHTHRMETF